MNKTLLWAILFSWSVVTVAFPGAHFIYRDKKNYVVEFNCSGNGSRYTNILGCAFSNGKRKEWILLAVDKKDDPFFAQEKILQCESHWIRVAWIEKDHIRVEVEKNATITTPLHSEINGLKIEVVKTPRDTTHSDSGCGAYDKKADRILLWQD